MNEPKMPIILVTPAGIHRFDYASEWSVMLKDLLEMDAAKPDQLWGMVAAELPTLKT
jgi:hypothetical protein